MAGLWEGLPASPCSAASDDPPLRSSRKPSALSKQLSKPPYAVSPLSDAHRALPQPRSTAQDPREMSSPPALKRSRSNSMTTRKATAARNPRDSLDTMDIDTNSTSASGSVEFVEAKDSNAESNSDLIARLNFSAADERRKALLQRLRAIDAKKAELSRNAAPRGPTKTKRAQSPSTDDDVVIIEEKRSLRRAREVSPTDVHDLPQVPATTSVRNKRKRNARAPVSRKTGRGKRSPPDSVQIIDVDDDISIVAPVVPPKPLRGKKSAAGKSIDSALPKRTSSRVRRPRTPKSDILEPENDKMAPTPVCMAKCKRIQFCKKLITSMLRNSTAAPFSAPVRQLWAPEMIPRYFDVISNPMDLGTVKKNLETCLYISPIRSGPLPYIFEVEKFADDVRLVFRNAMVYNRAGDMLYNCAKALTEDFEKSLERLPALPVVEEGSAAPAKKRSVGRKPRKGKSEAEEVPRSKGIEKPEDIVPSDDHDTDNVVAATATTSVKDSWTAAISKREESEAADEPSGTVGEMQERLQYLRSCRPAVLSRTPVPKGAGYLSRAALLYEIEISYQQKIRCTSAIENGKVPPTKLEGLVELVRKSSPGQDGVDAADDEFEFEFDNLDNKAWRNIEAFLEQFVPGFKTIRSSHLGREFSSVEDVDTEIESIRARLEGQKTETKRKVPQVANRPRSFFEDEEGDGDSSSDSSDDSDSDSSDSDSDLE